MWSIIDRDETVMYEPAWSGTPPRLRRYWIAEHREEELEWPGHGFRLNQGFDGVHMLMSERLGDGSQNFTIRPIREMERVLATAIHRRNAWRFEGDFDLWGYFEPYQRVWSER